MTSKQIGTAATVGGVIVAVLSAWSSMKAGKETAAQAAQNQSEFSATMAECRQAAADCRQATTECRQTTADCRDFMSRWSTPPSGGGYGSSIAPR